ncbi:MAG: hypothetical protein R3195_20575 [Gemmatimonadota bacterium]|nr:hypothetical protein [Gemmatimonadota bacterium]
MLRELSRFARDPHARQMLTLPLTLPRTLRAFFKDGPTIAGARGRLAGAVATREARFRAIARERVFARPDGPYGRLFRHAGCEEGDLARLLDTEGLEGTLSRLAGVGIYLMPDEIKGLRDVRRGSLSFRMDPRNLSGGRTGARRFFRRPAVAPAGRFAMWRRRSG